MKRWARHWGPPLTLLLLAFVLRVWRLGDQSLWYDEAYLWWATTEVSFSKMLALSVREIVPPGHYILLRGWAPLAGTTEFALRFPSALLGVLGVAAAGRLVGRLTSSKLGREMALALFALGTPLVWAAREVRMYGPLLTWTLLANVALIEILIASRPQQQRRWRWLWAVTTLMALYTLILAGFWLLGQLLLALLLLFSQKHARPGVWIKTTFPFATGVLLFFLPWLLAAARQLGENAGYWTGHLPISAFFNTAIQGMTISDFWNAPQVQTISWIILGLSLLSGLIMLPRPQVILYPLCYALPLSIMALIFRQLPKWGTRHAVLFSPVPLLIVALAWGTVRKKTRWLSLGILSFATLAYVTILLRANANLLLNPDFAHEDWRSVVAYVEEKRASEDIVIIETGSVFPAWAYYGGWKNILPLPDDELLNVNHILHYHNTAPQLNKALQETTTVWVVDWLGHVTDPTQLVPALLTYLGEEEPTPDFHELSLRQFELQTAVEFPSAPPTTAQVKEALLPHVDLWGYTYTTSNAPTDQPFTLWTWWTTDNSTAHIGDFHQILVRLLDNNGYEWGRVDTTPGGGDYRIERWPLAKPVLGEVNLPLDPWAPLGTYTPTLMLYSKEQTSQPLSLRPLSLTRPMKPPALPPDTNPVTKQEVEGDPPLTLLGVKIEEQKVTPCGTLSGRLFWEIKALSLEVHELTISMSDHQQRLEPAPKFAAQGWQVGDRFATPFQVPIDCRALDRKAPMMISLHSPEHKTQIATWRGPEIIVSGGRTFSPPGDMIETNVDFGPNFATLLGYRLDPPEPHTSEPFTLTLVWRAEETDDTPHTVFVHVTAPDTVQPITQYDSWPKLEQKPTHTWAPNEIIVDPHPLPGLPPGVYALRIGLYDPEGIRLQRAEAETTPGSIDRFDLRLEILP